MRLAGEIPLQASRHLVGALILLHALAVLLPWFAGLTFPVSLGISFCVLVSAVYALKQIRYQRNLRLRLHDSGGAELIAAERVSPVTLSARSSELSNFLLVLDWVSDGDGRHGSACLLSDGMSREDWRLVRRWFKWRLVNLDLSNAASPSATPDSSESSV
ncbi:MAG: hypothetical protein FWD62_13400 [Betaproteobacteria bacterium]|nr:hypothetical protein [Betaproteobacteria bacterium]